MSGIDGTEKQVTPGSAEERALLEAFADRLISREEVEEQSGLYLSQILLRLGDLGIPRRPVGTYEGMSEGQRRLFDEVFPDPELDAPSPD